MWWPDAVLALLLLLSAANGLRKGIIMGLAGMVGLVAGVYMAVRFSDLLTELLYIRMEWHSDMVPIMAFVLLFAAVLALMLLGGKVMESSMKAVQMDWLNRVLGAVFGLLKGAFILSLMLYLLQKAEILKIEPDEDSALRSSYLYKPLSKVAITVMPIIEDIDAQRWKQKLEDAATATEAVIRNSEELN